MIELSTSGARHFFSILANKIQYRLHYSFRDFSSNVFSVYNNPYFFVLDFIPLLKEKPATYLLRDGTRYMVRLNTADLKILNELYIFNQYGQFNKYLKDASNVIDVGAHIGTFSIMTGKYLKKGRIYCYEPDRKNFKILTNNININNMQNKIIAFRLGIASKKGKKNLFRHEKNSGMHSFFGNGKNKNEIETISLSDIFTDNKIETCDLLKIDCEGAEYEIIFNTEKRIFDKIKHIVLEYHSSGNPFDLIKYLRKMGFRSRIKDEIFKIIVADKI